MQTRTLGAKGSRVSALGLGCMGMSQSYGTPDDVESLATLLRALELGITFFDTADAYALGANETLVGRALQGRRSEVFLATKCGLVPGGTGPGSMGVDGSPAHIRAACDASLARLKVDRIDLYYLHRVDPKIPIEESVRAMAGLVDEGKVRYLGLSEVAPETLRRAYSVHPITAVQSEYSLWTRDVERGVLPVCRELGIGFVPFAPLGRGFLTGQVRSAATFGERDYRRTSPRFQGENLARNLSLVDALADVARETGHTPAQLALAWVLSRGPDIVPIPGTKRRRYLEENIAAASLALTPSVLARIEAAVPADRVAGARYSPDAQSMAGR